MIQIQKLYVVLDANGVIVKAFEQNTEKPISNVWYKKGANFDESTDFANAIIVNNLHFDDIIVGKSTIINGVFNKNENIA